MLALARANQSKWARGGPAVRGSLRQLPEARALPRLQRRPLPAAARRRRRRAGVGRRASPTAASRRRRRSWCASMRCARSGAGATCSRPSRAILQQWPNGPRHAEVAVQEGGGDGEARGRRRRRAQGRARRHADLPPGLGGGAARGLGRPRRASGSNRSPRRCPPPRRRSCARTPRASGSRAGWCCSTSNRNVESEAAFTSALAAPGLDADLECRARFHRAQSVWKQRQRPRAAPLFDEAEAACARAANRDLHAKALYQGARCYASAGNRDVAMARYARVETEHADHSYADDARLRSAELATDAGDERDRRQAAGGDPDPLPEGRPAERGAVAAGVLRLARGARRRRAALAGREPAPRPARGDLVRRGARPVLEGPRVREAGQDRRRRAPGTSAPCASTRCRSTRCCR